MDLGYSTKITKNTAHYQEEQTNLYSPIAFCFDFEQIENLWFFQDLIGAVNGS